MKTLIQINTAANYGSVGRIAENIGLLAQSNGWTCYLVHGPRYKNPSGLKTICSESLLEEKVHALKSFLFDAHGLGSADATRRLVKKIESLAPDIIHLHNVHGYYINYPILFDFLSAVQVPVVWTLHDCWSMTGHCSHFEFAGCNKWQTHCYSCSQLDSYPRSIFIDKSYRNFELKRKFFLKIKDRLHLIVVSDWLKDIALKSFFCDCNITRIHNGIDLDVFRPRIGIHKENKTVRRKIADVYLN